MSGQGRERVGVRGQQAAACVGVRRRNTALLYCACEAMNQCSTNHKQGSSPPPPFLSRTLAATIAAGARHYGATAKAERGGANWDGTQLRAARNDGMLRRHGNKSHPL